MSWLRGGPSERLAWRRYWLRDTAWGLGDTLIHHVMRLLPVEGCSALGAELGARLGPRNTGRAARTREAMARLRPDLAPDQLEAALARMWRNVGRVLGEFSVLPRIWASDRTLVHGAEHVPAARATGRPRIYVSVHLGNWEVVGPKLIELGEDLLEVYQPPANRFKRRIAEHTRRRFADRLLAPTPQSAIVARRHLTEKKGVLVLFVDEHVGGRVASPGFGRPLGLDGNLAKAVRMARLTGALLLPAYAVRGDGARFDLHVLPPVALSATGGREADLRADVERLNALFEPIVRRHAEQWFMLHNLRF